MTTQEMIECIEKQREENRKERERLAREEMEAKPSSEIKCARYWLDKRETR